jgi:uncharacterized caspase-like protein
MMPLSLARKSRRIFGLALFLGLALISQITKAAQFPTARGVKPVALANVGNYRNSWAVIIGINKYKNAPQLNYAVTDANSVVETLKQLGFPSQNILVLLDEQATKQHIEQVLYGTLRQTTADDRLFVFFAGHGLTVSLPRGGEEGYLLPVDGDPKDLALTAISMEDVQRIARRIAAKHILFAVDACYSGFAITRDVPSAKVDALYLEAMTREPAVQIITAGRKGEPVLEEQGHGLFTRRLIQGIMGLADADQIGVITALELATWVESRVIRDSRNRQHPQYSRLDGEGQFVFVVPRREETPAASAPGNLTEEVRRLAEEVERLKREKTLIDEQRKIEAPVAEKRKLEQASVKKSEPQPQLKNGKINEHIKIAKSYRDQGNYSAALSELEQAKKIDRANREVLAEIEITRKACNAEKRLGQVGLVC